MEEGGDHRVIPYPIIDMQATGERIRRRRLEHDLSIPQLQQFFQFSTVQAIYLWQEGKNLPSLDNFYALSVLLDTGINDFIVEKPETAGRRT